MRVLDRAVDESVVIGDGIHVTVLEVESDRVRLAIMTPNREPAYREETIYLDTAAKDCELAFAAR